MNTFFKDNAGNNSQSDSTGSYGILKGSVICIEGLVGVGKSVAGFSIMSYLNALDIKTKYYPEYFNHDLLNQYLSNMSKYAYYFQMFMLLKRIDMYKEALAFADNGGVSVIDRCVVGDYAFATMQHKKGYITDEDWKVYLSVMKQDRMRMPTTILYLQCSPSVAFERILKRNITSEVSGYTLEYLKDLDASYTETIDIISGGNNIICYIKWGESKHVLGGLLGNSSCIHLLECIKEKIVSNSF